MPFTAKQQEYFEKATHRWNIKTGATRSGKTFMDYYVIPKRIKSVRNKSGLIVILGNTKSTLQRNVIEPMQIIWGDKLVGNIKSDNTAILFGEKCYCLGADKVSQVNKLRGAGIKYCYGDEVVTWNEEVFQMLKSRLDKPYSKFDGTCNPDNPNHWFHEFLQSDADIYNEHYTIYDNEYLSPDVIKSLETEYRGTVFFDRYILGEWALAEGLIYPIYQSAIVPTIEREYEKYKVSMDYGTQNATSMGLYGLCQGVWYCIREYYYSGRKTNKQKTDDEYYNDLCEFVGDLNVKDIIIDPSAASFITLVKKKLRFNVIKANNEVLDGIRQTASAINTGLIKINDCCVNGIKELSSYVWQENEKEDAPVKVNDHFCDQLRYFVYTEIFNKKELRWG